MSASPHRGPTARDVIDERYTVERQLGEGGMGAVYLARHNVTGRSVALKWVQSDDRSLRQRLLREARAIAKVSHRSVVDVLDAGEHGQGVYIVLEYLSGDNLREHAAGRPLPPVEAVQLLMPALEGVAAAHQAGILHRDLKPENLFVCLDADGAVFDTKVLDFGVSKQVLGPAEGTPKQTALTQQGHIVGTPEYMAPEQISHAPKLDERTDVYAMGLVLYELLTGRLPYETRELRALLLDIVRGELPSPSRFEENLPGELCRVVMKALSTAPEQRYSDIAAFARALEPWSAGRSFEPPRKISTSSPDDSELATETLHRSGAIPVRAEPEGRRPDRTPVAATITNVQGARTRPSGRSGKPRARAVDRSDAALAANLHDHAQGAARLGALHTGLRLLALTLAALLIAAVAYIWLRPVTHPRSAARRAESNLPLPVPAMRTAPAAPVLEETSPAEVEALAPTAGDVTPAEAHAQAAPALTEQAATTETATEPATAKATPRARKRALEAKATIASPSSDAQAKTASEAHGVEVKTRAGTFGTKDF